MKVEDINTITEKNIHSVVEPEEDSILDIQIEKPYNSNDVDIALRQMTLQLFVDKIKENEINLDTVVQMQARLWDDVKQSRLIESLLIRLPLPAFYFDGSNDSNWLVIDGHQRLSTFKRFVIDHQLQLAGLEYFSQYNGFYYKNLPRYLQRRMLESEFPTYVIRPGTPEEVKYNIFKRINTGGGVLNPAEMRHTLHQSGAAQFVEKLAKLEIFKQATGNINPKRMEDCDFVTRFLAFYLTESSRYSPELDTFLNNLMKERTKTL